MSTMQIAVFPWDMERSLGLGDFIMSFILLSKERGVKCSPTSTGAIIEGDREILLEILDELNNTSFSKVARKVAITVNFDENAEKSLLQTKDRFLDEDSVNLHISESKNNKEKSDKRMLHDMVVKRLERYINDDEEFLG
ncbi:MAG TPA: thiamine-binding protein [Thermodesulfobacteriota bacterium]|nr:thiamine-binding protein [Thermodesulfobacteriota bacterium]